MKLYYVVQSSPRQPPAELNKPIYVMAHYLSLVLLFFLFFVFLFIDIIMLDD